MVAKNNEPALKCVTYYFEGGWEIFFVLQHKRLQAHVIYPQSEGGGSLFREYVKSADVMTARRIVMAVIDELVKARREKARRQRMIAMTG